MAWVFIVVGLLFIVGAVIVLMFYHEQGSKNPLNQIQNTRSKFDPNMTRFRAQSRTKVAKSQAELIVELNNVNSQITNSINIETEAIKANERLMNANYDAALEREKIDADHTAYIAVAQNHEAVARLASNNGIPIEAMKELVLEKARMETQLTMEYRKMELEVGKHRRMKQIDFEFEDKMAKLDAKMAEMEHLLPQHLINALHTQLSSLHLEYEEVKFLDEGDYKEREVKRVERKMKALEKNIREREKNI